MGKKNCKLAPNHIAEIVNLFMSMAENEHSKIFDNKDFGYWYITVERPLRLRVHPERSLDESGLKPAEIALFQSAVENLPADVPLDDWKAFAKATGLKAALLKKVRPFITEKDPTACVVVGEADAELRDTEIIPFTCEDGIEGFMKKEVYPYAPDAWVDNGKTKIGYEIIFNKYFRKKIDVRTVMEIADALESSVQMTDGIIAEIIGGLRNGNL